MPQPPSDRPRPAGDSSGPSATFSPEGEGRCTTSVCTCRANSISPELVPRTHWSLTLIRQSWAKISTSPRTGRILPLISLARELGHDGDRREGDRVVGGSLPIRRTVPVNRGDEAVPGVRSARGTRIGSSGERPGQTIARRWPLEASRVVVKFDRRRHWVLFFPHTIGGSTGAG